jgi:hypothetical protein
MSLLSKLKQLFVPALLLIATLGFTGIANAQATTGNGQQPTEATSGEVSLDTLNIHLNIPLVSKAGIGVPVSLSLSYDSNLWYPSSSTSWVPANGMTTAPGFNNDPTNLGGYFIMGGAPTCPKGYQGQTFMDYVDYNGVEHDINGISGEHVCSSPGDTENTYVTTDGSGLTLRMYYGFGTSQATGVNTVTYPNGTVVTPSTATNIASIKDVNGNTVSITNGVVTDTFNVAAVTVTGTPSSGSVTYAYPTSTGTADVVVTYTGYKLGTNFGCSGIAEYTATTTWYYPTLVTLPDTSTYTLTYESQVSGKITGRVGVDPSAETTS